MDVSLSLAPSRFWCLPLSIGSLLYLLSSLPIPLVSSPFSAYVLALWRFFVLSAALDPPHCRYSTLGFERLENVRLSLACVCVCVLYVCELACVRNGGDDGRRRQSGVRRRHPSLPYCLWAPPLSCSATPSVSSPVVLLCFCVCVCAGRCCSPFSFFFLLCYPFDFFYLLDRSRSMSQASPCF